MSEMNKDHQHLPLNLGSYGLHILHNAFKDARVKASGWEISSMLRAVYYLFKESPAQREDFCNTSVTKSLPLPFCSHCWLENLDAAESCLTIINPIKQGKSMSLLAAQGSLSPSASPTKLLLIRHWKSLWLSSSRVLYL